MFDLNERSDFLKLAIGFELGLAAIGLAIGWIFGVHPLDTLRWDAFSVSVGIAGTLPLIGLYLLFDRYPIGPLREIHDFLLEALAPALSRCRWYDLMAIAAVAGIGEELLFRGFLMSALSDITPASWLSSEYSVFVGLVISSMAFGLAHFITPAYALLAGCIGVYLGWQFYFTDNLLAPIVTHSLYDWFAFVMIGRTYARRRVSVIETSGDKPSE